jgi:FkbM family methyltransferase
VAVFNMSRNVVGVVDQRETLQYNAQFDEDRLLAEVFNGKLDGRFVEVGAYNGVANSNTYYFEQLGWSGVLIEANPTLAEQCRVARPRSKVFAGAVVGPGSPPVVTFELAADPALSSLKITPDMMRRVTGRAVSRIVVPARTLDEVLVESGLTTIDFITIDVEGHEFDVLRGFSLAKWKPRIVILERNTHLPEARLVQRMHAAGYVLERRTGVNDWYFLADLESARQLRYRLRLFVRFYLPKLVTLWRPILRAAFLKSHVLK